MGWGYGTDETGKEVGYTVAAICEHPGCDAQIDRGLAFACGGEHGAGVDRTCNGYFCESHLFVVEDEDGDARQVCFACAALYPDEKGGAA